MTPKQTALVKITQLVLGGLFAGAATYALLELVPVDIICIGLVSCGLVSLLKLVYDIELSKAETLEKLNK